MFAKNDPEHNSKLICGNDYQWNGTIWKLLNYRRSTDRAILQQIRGDRYWVEPVSLAELEKENGIS